MAQAVEIEPDYSARKFKMVVGGKTYVVTWEIDQSVIVLSMSEVSADAFAFEGLGYAYTTVLVSGEYELDVSFDSVGENGQVNYTISWKRGWSESDMVTGTLSADGNYISAEIEKVQYRIYKNAVKDADTSFVMLKDTDASAALAGKFQTTGGDLQIGIAVESSYDYDDEFDGFETPKFVVTYGGEKCTVKTSFSAKASSVEFTVDGKTYEAKIVNDQMTVTEKTAA